MIKNYCTKIRTNTTETKLNYNETEDCYEIITVEKLNEKEYKYLPKKCYYDYILTVESINALTIHITTDPRSVISIALLDKSLDCLTAYSDILPILAINESRFEYTCNAFYHASSSSYTFNDAIQFYINTDLKQIQNEKSQNVKTSKLIHYLQSSGYENYIFQLADKLKVNIDIIHLPKNTVYCYTKYDVALSSRITAIYHNGYWYVVTSSTPIWEKNITNKSNRAEHQIILNCEKFILK